MSTIQLRYFVQTLLTIGFASLVSGCTFGPYYNVALYNATPKTIDHVGYIDAPRLTPAGILGSEMGSTSLWGDVPVPTAGTIVWQTEDKVDHQQTVAIRSVISDPDHFEGKIIFKITDDGVQVAPWPKSQSDRTWQEYPWSVNGPTPCAPPLTNRPVDKESRFSFRARNTSTAPIGNVEIHWREPQAAVDRHPAVMSLAPGTSSMGIRLSDLPEHVDVRWTSTDGQTHHVDAAVPPGARKIFSGKLVISIGDDGQVKIE